MIRGFLSWLFKPLLIVALVIWLIKDRHSLFEAAKGLGVIFLILASLAIVIYFFNWLITWPRRNKIKRLFPLASTELSDEHERFLLYDLSRWIKELQHEAMRYNNRKAYKALDRICPLIENLQYRAITAADIQELNAIYGFHSKEGRSECGVLR